MKVNRIRIAFVGSGGDGVMSVASMVMRVAAGRGLYGLMAQSYGPQIRGGEAAAFLNLSEKPVYAENFKKDLVICFSFKNAERFSREFGFSKHCVLLHDAGDKHPVPEWMDKSIETKIAVPFSNILKESQLPLVSKNVFTFGMLTRIFDWSVEKTSVFIEQTFIKKGPGVVNANLKAFKLGYSYGEKVEFPFECDLKENGTALRTVIGNVACAEAAVKAGCRFFAGYPITPSSEVLGSLIKLLPSKNGKLIQAEDEIASLGMVIGASYGGVPAMTATSGPGLSLMTEMLGLASMIETPVVVLNVQRGGPSTGIPSKTEQADLFHAIYGGHGDFPRVVLAATDVEDCWLTMYRAFYIAEKYCMPVIVLTDGYIGQRGENIPLKIDISKFPKPERFRMEAMPQEGEKLLDLYPDLPRGVRPTVIPGTDIGTFHHVAGIEQDEKGRPSATREVHEKMSERRLLKMKSVKKDTDKWYEVMGDPKSKYAVVVWGSTRGAIAQLLEENNNRFKVFVPRIIHPFPKDAFKAFIKDIDELCFVELNFQGQLYQYVRTFMNLPENTQAIKLGGGSPMSPLEIEHVLKKTSFKEVIK